MKRKFLNLKIFDGEGAAQGGDQGAQGSQGAQGQGQGAGTPAGAAAGGQGTYSYAQAEEIATARAQKAERDALTAYFKQQGLDENQVSEALKAYKAAQKAKEPDVAAITKERDEALAKVEAYEQQAALAKKGVKAEFSEFVAFKARELMRKDAKLDTFEKAADKILKDNPQYAGGTTGYRVKTKQDEGKAEGKAAAMATLNDMFKAAARRR